MTDEYELTWKRNPETGDYTATDDRPDPPVTYGVARTREGRPGWMLVAFSRDFPAQTRTGFSTRNLAQAAALETRCFRCNRHLPFATMTGNDSIKGWHCRNWVECTAAEAARDAEFRRITAEIRNTPWEDCSIRDTEAGPELVIRMDSRNSTVVRATEPDLDRLLRVLLNRRKSRILSALAKSITQCDELLARHENEPPV